MRARIPQSATILSFAAKQFKMQPCFCVAKPMTDYRREFLELAIQRGALKFGEFTLKSGRTSPYFFNLGELHLGSDLAALGRFYALATIDSNIEFDTLFGPAYKGIPLVSTLAATLATQHDIDRPWCFNRKEAKTHGEGGNIVGAAATGRVLIVDDVITAGTAIRGAIDDIRNAGGQPNGVVVALDRQERGNSELSAIQEVQRDYGIGIQAIARLDDLLALVEARPDLQQHQDSIRQYKAQYGV